MSMCGICGGEIKDGLPYDEKHLSYDGCEENYEEEDEEYR